MSDLSIPSIDMSDNPTGCCPRFDPEPWHGKQMHLQDQLFVKAKMRCFFYIPLNMGAMFTRVLKAIDDHDGAIKEGHLVMSYTPSMWRSEHYFAVNKAIPGEQMVQISGDFLMQVYEGPFSQAGQWMQQLAAYVSAQGRRLLRPYMFYTTCPKCAKTYGKNYVVGIAQVSEKL